MSRITETTGSIFDAPPGSILLHANNSKGSWGSGVAATFKQKYPAAYKIYNAHCNSATKNPHKQQLQAHQKALVGTTLLIPPQETDTANHYIANLFTSYGYGRSVAPPADIVEATRRAMEDLERQVEKLMAGGEEVGGCWAVRMNSGRFGVEWERTKEVLEAGGLSIKVVRREGDAAREADEGEADTEKAGEKRKRKTVRQGGTLHRGGGEGRGRGRGRGRGGGTLNGWLK